MVGLCRLCASFRKMDSLIIINDESNEICQKLRKCCQLDIQLHDTLPKSVCQECLENLNVSHKFFVKVQESQETLQTLFPTKTFVENRENDSWVSLANTLAVATGQNKRKCSSTKNDKLSSAEDYTIINDELQTQKLKVDSGKEKKQIQTLNHLVEKETPIENVHGTLETVKNEKYLEEVYNELGMCKDEMDNENTYDVLETTEQTIDEGKAITVENFCEIFETVEDNIEQNEAEEHKETIYVDNQMDLCSEETQLEEHLANDNLANEEGFMENIDEELCIENQNLDTQVQSDWYQESDIELQYIEVVQAEQDQGQQVENEETQSEIEVEIIDNDQLVEMCDETLSSPLQIKSWQSYTYLCIRCDYNAKSFIDLKIHAELEHKITHMDKLQFQCYDCQKIIPKYSFFLNHIRSQHHPALKLQCDVCDMNCENYEQLAVHRSMDCLEANKLGYLLSCTQCFKSFHTTYGLHTHNKQQHSISEIKEKYQCTHCGKVFKQKSCVRAHELRHTDKKRYSCVICDSAFVNKQNLDLHLYTHIEGKTYQCKKCDKSFKTFLTLDRHQDVHLKQKPFKCQYCEKDFRNKGEKLAHERVHTGELPFKCKQCDKRFSFLSSLNVHIRNHNGEKPFACNYCDKTFIDTSNRNKHMKHKHANKK